MNMSESVSTRQCASNRQIVETKQSHSTPPLKLAGVKGMNDIVPVDGVLWQALERHLHGWLDSYGYRNMRTPVLEQTALFRRGIGEVTDIVEKEMFSFTDRLNGDELTMRPEFTAGLMMPLINQRVSDSA